MTVEQVRFNYLINNRYEVEPLKALEERTKIASDTFKSTEDYKKNIENRLLDERA